MTSRISPQSLGEGAVHGRVGPDAPRRGRDDPIASADFEDLEASLPLEAGSAGRTQVVAGRWRSIAAGHP